MTREPRPPTLVYSADAHGGRQDVGREGAVLFYKRIPASKGRPLVFLAKKQVRGYARVAQCIYLPFYPFYLGKLTLPPRCFPKKSFPVRG